MMAAASADVPAIVLPVGPMLVGHHQGESARCMHRLPATLERLSRRSIGAAEIETDQRAARADRGHLHGDGHGEHDGVHRRGDGHEPAAARRRIPATHADRIALAPKPAAAPRSRLPRRRPRAERDHDGGGVSQRARRPAGIGGSTNALIHLTAIAGRLGISIDLDEFDALGREVPVLIDLKPSGQHYMEHFHWAGGVPRLLRELEDLLDLEARDGCRHRWPIR